MPAFDRGDDAVGIGGPCERLGLQVVLGEEAVDGGLEVDEGMEDAALEAAFGELGKEALCIAAQVRKTMIELGLRRTGAAPVAEPIKQVEWRIKQTQKIAKNPAA